MQIGQHLNCGFDHIRFNHIELAKPVISSYILSSALIYIIVVVHTPLTLLPAAGHDDGLFMALGRSLSEGRWLGRFNEFTLMKGPGYPAFLALANWLGISVSLAHALFHCAVIIIFVWVAQQFIRSLLVSGVLFTLLLWHPAPITAMILRVLRDEIYYGQVLLFFSLLTYVLFSIESNQRRLLFAIPGGAALGWLWLTREEGVWILPGLGVLVGMAVLYRVRERKLLVLAWTLVVLIGVFAATQASFRAINWLTYGKFVGVDVKEANFQRALGALHSVHSGGVKPFVSVTRAARERVYAVSPTFASLSSYLDTPPDRSWAKVTCTVEPESCGEIGAAWFIWALRTAAAEKGHYQSPAKATAFFGHIADEVSAACANGSLDCAPQLVPEMPPWNWAQVANGLPQLYRDAFNLLLLLRPPLQLVDSQGTEELLETSSDFLHYPTHTPSAALLPFYTLSGWYYKSGNDWVTITARGTDGNPTDVQVDRNLSPDIREFFKDSSATRQRFVIYVHCNANCLLQLRTPEGEYLERPFADLSKGLGFPLGKGHFQIDTIEQVNPPPPTLAENFASRFRVAVVSRYQFVFVPALALGVLAFLGATMLHCRKALGNVCYILAFAYWLLAFSRATLLILVSATSFPAVTGSYFAPAYFLSLAGAAFSCAAWLQLSGRQLPPLASAGVEPGQEQGFGLGQG